MTRSHSNVTPPDSLVASQIQKPADRSDVISEVPKCSKIQIFWGSAPDPAEGAYSAPQTPYLMGRGLAPPCQEPHPPGLMSTDLRIQPITELATLLMIDFKCSSYFSVSENGQNGLDDEWTDRGNAPRPKKNKLG